MNSWLKTVGQGLVIALIAIGLPGCGKKEEEKPAKVQEAEAKPGFVVVNVLDKEVYDDCHIKGSINVSYENLKEYAERNWDKNATKVVVYCANYRCQASLEAAKMLVKELGFKKENVWAYEGGSAAAKHDGLPMEGACKEAYLTDVETGAKEEAERDGIQLISTKNLKEMMEKFAKSA